MDLPGSGKIGELVRLVITGEIGEAAARWNRLLECLGRTSQSLVLPASLLPFLRSCLQAQEIGDWVAWADALENAYSEVLLCLENNTEQGFGEK